jgi:hypothetical protein
MITEAITLHPLPQPSIETPFSPGMHGVVPGARRAWFAAAVDYTIRALLLQGRAQP